MGIVLGIVLVPVIPSGEGGRFPTPRQAFDYEKVYFSNDVGGRRLRKQFEDYCRASKKGKSEAIRTLLGQALESNRVWVQQRLTEYVGQEPMTSEGEEMVKKAMERGLAHFRR